MTDPKPWLDDDAGTPLGAAALLSVGREMDPPDGAQQAVWIALGAKIAAGAGAAGAAGAASASGAGGASAGAAGAAGSAAAGAGAAAAASTGFFATILPSMIAGAIGGVVAIASYTALEAPTAGPTNDPGRFEAPHAIEAPAPTTKRGPAVAETPRSQADRAPSAAGTLVVSAPGAATDAANAAPTAAPAGAGGSAASSGAAMAPSDPSEHTTGDSSGSSGHVGGSPVVPGSPEERASQLREEAAMVAEARSALRGGNAAEALRRLEAIRQKFPGGTLGQEREALAIEALARSGAVDAASARAKDFIARHPTSPHAARLQAFVR